MNGIRLLTLLTLILGTLSCQKEDQPIKPDITALALEHLTLSCDHSIESPYYLKGKIGDEEFCHYPGYDGYYIYTVNGNTFVTYSPDASTSNPSNLTGYSRFFYFNIKSDTKPDIPEETVGISVKLPNEGNFAEEFFKIMQPGPIDYVDWTSESGGIILSLDLLVRTNPNNDGHKVAKFSTTEGSQSNSHFTLLEFTSDRADDHYYGEAKFQFSADLYYSKSSGREGLWRSIEGEMVIPWTLYLL